MPALLVYLHGFNSGPASLKARQTADWLNTYRSDIEYWVPQLCHRPKKACQSVLEQLLSLESEREIALIGSSLGAFYALWLQAQLHQHGQRRKIVLINPAVHPDRVLDSLRGPQENHYSGERYLLDDQHLNDLLALKVTPALPDQIYLLLQRGDELLDYREALERLPTVKTELEAGGDHSFMHFDQHLTAIMTFFGFWPR